MDENVIEFIKGQDRATLTLTQGRFITKIKYLAGKYPTECDFKENPDGSVLCHIPVSWLHISKITRSITEEQREDLANRIRELHNTL